MFNVCVEYNTMDQCEATRRTEFRTDCAKCSDLAKKSFPLAKCKLLTRYHRFFFSLLFILNNVK